MTRPRVALVALHFAEYASNLALALTEKWEVLLIIYRDNAENELGVGWDKWLRHPSLTVVALDQPKFVASVINNTYTIVSNIKRFQPGVIHYQEGLRDEIALSLPFFPAVPKVLTVHDPASHSGTDSIRLQLSRYRLYRFLIRRVVAGAITHGAFLSSELARICPSLKGKIHSIAHGPLGTRNGEEFSEKPKELRLLFFGRIHEYKGLRFFVDAIIKLKNEGLPVIGVVAGRGVDLNRHRQRMLEAGCFQILERYIPATEVHTLFSEAFAVVLPYTDATQSGVAALALGFARPVVASAVGSIPELVRHGQNGLLVPPSDTNALVQAIRLLVTSDGLWRQLSVGAKVLRTGELSWKTLAHETGQVYATVSN